MICALMFMISNQYGIKCLSNLLQLEQCIVLFKVNSDIMALWIVYEYTIVYEIHGLYINTIVIVIIFCNAKIMIKTSMFHMSNHEIKCLSNLLQLEPCYV